MLWRGGPGLDRPGAQQRAAGEDERKWVEKEFIGGWKPHVKKLGQLLAGYEEEREGERERVIRRQKAQDEMVPEEDSDSDDEDEEDELDGALVDELEDMEVTEAAFLRLVHERFIYGMLDVGLSHRFSLVDVIDNKL
jgi:TATA-binding protein-associated factor Taf7